MTRPRLADELDLAPHPDGGWYRRTWTSPEAVTLPDGRVRATATAIHFLLPEGECSTWHRLRSDELWLAHLGVAVLQFGGRGAEPVPAETVRMGPDLDRGTTPQVVVPAGTWQRTFPQESDALFTCVVSPGFRFSDVEVG